MDETVVSKFYVRYYLKAICGGIITLCVTGYLAFFRLFGYPANPGGVDFFTILFPGLLCVYFYFFSKSWKRITVTPAGIIVFDVVFKKQFTIPYTAITRTGTYRPPGTSRYGNINAQDFVIEFNDNQSLTFNESYYDNYNQLTMAIYNYKYGPGHGRERYLERRGGSGE